MVHGLNRDVPTADLTALHTDPGVKRDWLAAIRRNGFAKVTGMAPEPGGPFDIAALFGNVRETDYGRQFEARNEVNPVNLACTGLGPQAQTDTPCRDPAPTLQVLSRLQNSTDGGENMMADGCACARRLLTEEPRGFALMSGYPAGGGVQPGPGRDVHRRHRVLHARRGYSGEGSRWLQRCRADRDGLLSTLAAPEAGS